MSTLVMPETHEKANVSYHLDGLVAELQTDERVFCVSEASRQALELAFPSVRNKTATIYQYVDWPEDFALMDHNLPPLRLGRYAVVIGTIEPRKNLGLLVNALSMSEISRSTLKFVVIGRRGWLVDKFLEAFSEEQKARLVFTSFISEFAKYRLLKHAEFLIFPSVYEGFGIPALEAMSLGKPVIAARTSSLPEVVGEGGIFFDPFSAEDLSAAIREVSSKKKAKELAKAALERSSHFNWERMAEPLSEWVTGKVR